MNLPALFGLLCTGVLIVCAMGFSGHSIHVFVDSSALLIVPIGTLCLLGPPTASPRPSESSSVGGVGSWLRAVRWTGAPINASKR